MNNKSNYRSVIIKFKKISTSLLAASLIVSGGSFASADTKSESTDAQFDFIQKASEQGYEVEAQDLKIYIKEKANDENRTYEEVEGEIFAEVQRIHAKHSNEPLYNDLSTDISTSARTTNAVPLSSVTQAYVTPLSNKTHLLKKTETVVSGGLNIQYGVDTVIYSSGSFREFVSINSSSAFVLPSGSGTHNWSPAYQTATLESPINVSFRAYGNLESTVSKSVSAGFTAAGFSISGTTGTTVTLRKSHQISHNFSLY